MDGRKQCILVGQDCALKTIRYLQAVNIFLSLCQDQELNPRLVFTKNLRLSLSLKLKYNPYNLGIKP